MISTDNFERKFLFRLTRLLALFFIFILLAGVIIGGVIASGILIIPSTKVTTAEVLEEIKPKPFIYTPDTSTTDSMASNVSKSPDLNIPGIKLPFILQKHLTNEELLKILRGWLELLAEEHRQEFLDELSVVVNDAEKSGANIPDTIDKYKQIKFLKFEKEALARQKLAQTRLYYAGAAFGSISLIALFSLILVLLAIERNTRQRVV